MLFNTVLCAIGAQKQLNAHRVQGEPKIFAQRLDHFAFGPNALKTFNQRYFENMQHVVAGKPVDSAVIEIGGEGSVDGAPGAGDMLGKVAARYNAPIFELEHRFYGESQPFGSDPAPLKTDYLNYLTSRHAIADLVNFVWQKDKEYCALLGVTPIPGKPCLRWLIAGGSYAGAVSAWITQQHPHLFAATISSSGVVDAHYELPEFDMHTLSAAGTPCANAYLEAMRKIEQVTESGDDKYLTLFGAYRTKLADFYYFLADSSLMAIQYGSWNKICQKNLNVKWANSEDVTDAFVAYLKANNEYIVYDRDFLKVDNDLSNMMRQWWWQTCVEVAYFQPAPQYNNIRSQQVTTKWHLDICEYAFGLKLGDPTPLTNAYYGNRLVYGPDTFFSNFWQDVWHICGVTKQTANVPAENIGYINCRDCGHCVDLHPDKESDPESLTKVREDEVAFVSKRFDAWLERK